MRYTAMTIFLTAASFSAAEAESIRIMTYNIHHGEGTDGKLDLDRIADIILAEHPDIVCLQEIDRNLPRTSKLDFPEELAKRLNMKGRFGPNYRFDGGDYGNATFTRFEISAHENVSLPGPEGIEPRGALRVTVNLDGRELDVWNTHLGLGPGERRDQAAAIVDHLRPGVPAVLAGDLNETRDAPALQQLLTVFNDTWSGNRGEAEGTVGLGGKRPKRIDFVLATPELNVLSSRAVVNERTAVASDHAPYVAELGMGRPPVTPADRGVYDENDERVVDVLVQGE